MTMTSRDPILRLRDLAIGYHRPLVRDIDMTVSVGDIIGIIGRNGCGKSTLLRTIAGIVAPLGGTIEISGRDLTASPPWKRAKNGEIAYLSQDERNFRGLSVRENMHLALWHSGDGWKRREQQILALLSNQPFSALADHPATPAAQLSGGQALLLALAKCILRKSRLVLLDEPSAGLFETYRRQLPAMIQSLAPETAVILVEQSFRIVFMVAREVYVVSDSGHTNGPHQEYGRLIRLQESTRLGMRNAYESGNEALAFSELAELLSMEGIRDFSRA